MRGTAPEIRLKIQVQCQLRCQVSGLRSQLGERVKLFISQCVTYTYFAPHTE
jgi:hypothetical protein